MTSVPKDQTVSGLPNIAVNITAHDESGREYFVSSDKAQWQSFADGVAGMSTLFTTDYHPDLNDDADIKKHQAKIASNKVGLVNPNGTTLRVVDFAPAKPELMHRTKSLDYGVCISGEVEAILASGEKRIMRPGDVCVQRGTDHGWRNTSETEWARMCFVLLDIQPVVVGGEKLGETFHGLPVEITPSGNDE